MAIQRSVQEEDIRRVNKLDAVADSLLQEFGMGMPQWPQELLALPNSSVLVIPSDYSRKEWL